MTRKRKESERKLIAINERLKVAEAQDEDAFRKLKSWRITSSRPPQAVEKKAEKTE